MENRLSGESAAEAPPRNSSTNLTGCSLLVPREKTPCGDACSRSNEACSLKTATGITHTRIHTRKPPYSRCSSTSASIQSSELQASPGSTLCPHPPRLRAPAKETNNPAWVRIRYVTSVCFYAFIRVCYHTHTHMGVCEDGPGRFPAAGKVRGHASHLAGVFVFVS